ncbi:hypothetical protein EV1_032072 [Malus domestica]
MFGRHRLCVLDHYEMVKIHHHPFVIISPAFVAALALQGQRPHDVRLSVCFFLVTKRIVFASASYVRCDLRKKGKLFRRQRSKLGIQNKLSFFCPPKQFE